MKKIYIWGAGNYSKAIYETIKKDRCVVVGIVDNNKAIQGKCWEGDFLIESPLILLENEFDYVLISVRNFQPILDECIIMGIQKDKIILFWELEESTPYIDISCEKKQIIELKGEINNLWREIGWCKRKLENQPYEWGLGKQINIKSSEELLDNILKNQTSLCRFGDGELEIMRGKERLWYQNVDAKLSERLKEVFISKDKNILIAIANNFGSLESYTDAAADNIRAYLSGDTREKIMDMIDMNRDYYDAYVSRPYLMYRDKNHAKGIFDIFQKIWNNRNVLIVEGKYTRTGVGNNLLINAKKIKRILCPDINAFKCYDKIFKTVFENVSEGDLVLLTLGPTATVLAFDLAKSGIQALDIGQLDTEYEWYLCQATERVSIYGKTVAELEYYRQPDETLQDNIYNEQIVAKVFED